MIVAKSSGVHAPESLRIVIGIDEMKRLIQEGRLDKLEDDTEYSVIMEGRLKVWIFPCVHCELDNAYLSREDAVQRLKSDDHNWQEHDPVEVEIE